MADQSRACRGVISALGRDRGRIKGNSRVIRLGKGSPTTRGKCLLVVYVQAALAKRTRKENGHFLGLFALRGKEVNYIR